MGNSLLDSIFCTHFWTLNADTLSAISGIFTDEDSTANGRILLRARQVSPGDLFYSIELDKAGPYVFQNILPGIYLIDAFRDADGNGVYSYGQPLPFVPAERFVFYADSINVRSRWPNEGNDITLLKWDN